MESLSRPPHRREHSTTTNVSSSSSFSFKNPYDNVLLSKGGKVKFEAHEYADIFSGSSSIPVLDLSSLNERVRPADFRSSKLDYSNIFGEFRDDDNVALPYEQLFNGSVKKTKTRIQSDVDPPLNKPGSMNSSAKTKRSEGASEQSTDGIKKQFNISFNKTSQRKSDDSNGETHIAQLHAVPGFTHFVDETPPLQNKEYDSSKPSMKREVSRTWSFSSCIEPVTVKNGIAVVRSHTPDKSGNVIGINPKSHTMKGASPSSHRSSPNDTKDFRQSRLPSLASKDASRKSSGEYSPLLFDEELDENSVAAVSVAALKKAIEQAQESIRIAKMIMEKRKEDLKDGSKPRCKSCLKVKDEKESRIHSVPDASKEKNEEETYGKLDPPTYPLFTCNDSYPNVGMVRENVEVANDHAVTGLGKRFAPSCSQREIPKTDENVGLENVGPPEACGETINLTGLAAIAICRTVTFESGKVDTCIEQMETGKETLEHRELNVDRPKGPEVISEMVESDPKTSQSVKELEKCVDEAFRQCLATFDHMAPKIFAEKWETVLECSEVIQEEETMHEGGGNLRISQEDELNEENGSVGDDKEKCENIVGHEKLDCLEQLAGLKSEFDNFQNDSRSLSEKDVMEQVDIDKKPENFCEWKENKKIEKISEGQENETVLEEEHHWFESELQLTEPVEEEDINLMEPEIYQEANPGIKENVVHEPENVDKKLNCKDGQNRHMDSSDCETAQMETDNYPEVLNVEDKIEFKETTKMYIDEAITAHCNGSRTIFSETHEPCDGDLNCRENQAAVRGCKINNCFPLENLTFLGDEDNDTGRTIHLELNEMPGTDCLYRCASEEKFIESQQNNSVVGLSSDSESDNVDLVDADHEETMFETASEIHNALEIEDKNAKPVLERSPESGEECLLTSFLQNIEMVSTHESACRGSLEDNTPNKEEGKDRLVITSDEREYVGGQSERLHPKDRSGCLSSPSNCELKEMDKSMESGRELEKGQDMEKKKENPSRTYTVGQKDVQGNDHQDRIEAIKRGRKQEKDRMAVERAIREARERAFAEARHRAMAEACQKLKRVFVENKNPGYKVSNEVKLRAERAAVERATAEARERALEKAMSQKTYTEARTQAEKYPMEILFTSRNNGLKHSLSSSGLEKFDGAVSESAQRHEARLERHQRIMERAAKALAEKNTCDLLAQKEQAERNRLAESLDADIKRWATGKEKNLCALLSTLQYILGAESGWQAVPLTEMLTTGSVKKAYRKATLCVHPDKLQQRGATIHQKYICEKVFDILKAAWNRFNSEER